MIWRITLESSTTILEASFTLIYDGISTGFTCDNCLYSRPLLAKTVRWFTLIKLDTIL